MLRIVKIYPVH